MYQKHASKLLSLTLCLGFVLFSQFRAHGQRSLGVPEVWVYQPKGALIQQSKPEILGNHLALTAAQTQEGLNEVASFRKSGLSIFLVVRPKFFQSLNTSFFDFKGVRVSDSAITFRGVGKGFSAQEGVPLIISASLPVREVEGAMLKSSLIDSALYDVFEIIAYNKTFSREELRRVEAYLSLKYSIPTTGSDAPAFKSYPGDSVGQFLWNKKQDKSFDQEVLAIGNFPYSGLLQSQTVAYHKDSIVVALDSIVTFGDMPAKNINEGSFLILSKRSQASSTYSCEYALNQNFPISSWRLKPVSWISSADSLRILYKDHQNSVFADTVILTNGLDTIGISTIQKGADLLIAIPLAPLQNEIVYQFRVKSNNCLDSSDLGIIGLSPGVLQIMNRSNADNGKLSLHIQSLYSSFLLDTLLPAGYSFVKINRNGQYSVDLVDEEGNTQDSYLLMGKDSNGPEVELGKITGAGYQSLPFSVQLYPNPQTPFGEVIIDLENLAPMGTIQIVVNDALGRVVARHFTENVSDSYRWKFKPTQSGFYTVTVKVNDQLTAKKLLVLKNL